MIMVRLFTAEATIKMKHFSQRKTQGQQPKGKIVSALFHTFLEEPKGHPPIGHREEMKI